MLVWLAISAGIAATMLVLTYIVSLNVQGDPSPLLTPLTPPRGTSTYMEVATIIRNNLLVLALHAFACFAGYITHVALPQSTTRFIVLQWLNNFLGSIAMLFVPGATLFSIAIQSWVIGERVATLSLHIMLGKGSTIISAAPHAMLELTAVFLPLAAWLYAGFRRRWNELLAATVVSVCIALPMVAVAGVVEQTVWPSSIEVVMKKQKWWNPKAIGVLVNRRDGFLAGYVKVGERIDQADERYKSEAMASAAALEAIHAGWADVLVIVSRDGAFDIRALELVPLPGRPLGSVVIDASNLNNRNLVVNRRVVDRLVKVVTYDGVSRPNAVFK